MNQVAFIGRLAKDVDTRETQNGKTVANFSIAIDRGFGDNKKTSFFNIVAFESNATNIAKFFSKGDRIALECEADQSTWTDKDGNNRSSVNFIVRHWEFCETKKSEVDPDGFMKLSTKEEDDELPFS